MALIQKYQHVNCNCKSGSKEENVAVKKRQQIVIPVHIELIDGVPPLYRCTVCDKKFKTKAHVKYHEVCGSGAEKPFICSECGQGFIAKSHYEYHLRIHTGERPYPCPKCGKRFNQRGKVTRHMRSHTGEKPFPCVECGRRFANAQALRSHILIHTGERPFACTYCDKRFTGMTNLKKHIITHTGERPFTCKICYKSFGLKWTLDLHLRTHSSERPYQCSECSRAFSNSKDLRRHSTIHSGERPFKCWICGTAFRRKDNLDRHIRNTHNQPKSTAKELANKAYAEYLKAQRALLAKKSSEPAITNNIWNTVRVPNNMDGVDFELRIRAHEQLYTAYRSYGGNVSVSRSAAMEAGKNLKETADTTTIDQAKEAETDNESVATAEELPAETEKNSSDEDSTQDGVMQNIYDDVYKLIKSIKANRFGNYSIDKILYNL